MAHKMSEIYMYIGNATHQIRATRTRRSGFSSLVGVYIVHCTLETVHNFTWSRSFAWYLVGIIASIILCWGCFSHFLKLIFLSALFFAISLFGRWCCWYCCCSWWWWCYSTAFKTVWYLLILPIDIGSVMFHKMTADFVYHSPRNGKIILALFAGYLSSKSEKTICFIVHCTNLQNFTSGWWW